MRLKKLKIHGFKSFADKVTLEFHEGITGIVGPNGCGKSNIADAFRWVLGETSARSLRGKKMEDVIFAGTVTRKPVNLAEATITLTEINGLLPTEYDELEITRRCLRSGETEYLINRQPVRMRDVINLFLDSGVGKHAFSIFEQGNIDEIIQKSPKERRTIFEEAAGILRFFERKREAERKLELSETNISRIKDIHQEIHKQIALLKEQAKEAETFQGKKEQLEDLECRLLFAKQRALQEEKQKLNAQETIKKQEIAEIEASITRFSKEITELKAGLEDKERHFQEMNERLFNARSEKEAKLRERESNSERMKESLTRLADSDKQLHALDEMQKRQKEETKSLEDKIRQAKAREKELRERLDRERAHLAEIEEKVLDNQKSESALKEEKFLLMRSEREIEGEIKESRARFEAVRERREKTDRESLLRKRAKEDLLIKQGEQKKVVGSLSDEVESKKKILQKIDQEEGALRELSHSLEEELETLKRDFIHAEARLKTLIRLKEEMEGAQPAFKRLSKESSLEKSPIYGLIKPLFEVVKIKGENKPLLMQALKPYSETFVVKDQEALKKVLLFAKQEKLQDLSLFLLESLDPEGGGCLEERINAHFLKPVRKEAAWKEAASQIKKGGAALVLIEEGGVIDHNLVYTLRGDSEKNAFFRESEIEDLKKRSSSIDLRKQEVFEKAEIARVRRGELSQRKAEADRDLRKTEMRQLESNFLLQKIGSDLEVIQEEEAKHSEEEKISREALSRFEKKLEELQEKMAAKGRELQQLEKKSMSALQRYEEEKLDFERKKASLVKLQAEFDATSVAVVRQEGELKVLHSKAGDAEKERDRLEMEKSHLDEWQKKCKVKSSTFEEALHRADEVLSIALNESKALEGGIKEQKRKITEFEESLKKGYQGLEGVKELLSKVKIKEAEVDVSLKAKAEEFLQKFKKSIDTDEIEVKPLDIPSQEAERRIRNLRKEIEEVEGRINMTSIEELKKQQERHSYLQTQVDDMNVSKEEILKIIASLDNESRQLFEETFIKVRANFQKNFKILFGEGGEADLELIDSKDILEAGIEIVAKPPGKKMRSINLLSGGEKCLTSMALLFSIFEIKPAPFCILDEIDAPLDDTNVERFLNVVRTFADRCQFIIITHNKRTMAIADRLFGVSMEERGVSKLLSIEFNRESSPKTELVEV